MTAPRSAQYCSCVMAKKATFDLPALVKAFVQKVNSEPREPRSVDEVPRYLPRVLRNQHISGFQLALLWSTTLICSQPTGCVAVRDPVGAIAAHTHASITICPITSDCVDAPLFRVALPPGDRTGLLAASQVMVDKVSSVPRTAVDQAIGACDGLHLEQIEEALRRWLDLNEHASPLTSLKRNRV